MFILRYENTAQLALFYNKLYKTQWQKFDDLKLSIKGLNLDKVWQEFVFQIADVEVSEHESLDENRHSISLAVFTKQ